MQDYGALPELSTMPTHMPQRSSANSKLLWHRLEKGCMEKQPPLNTTFKGEGRGREEGEGRGARQLSSLAVPGHPVKDTSRRPRRTWCAARGLTPSADAAMSAGFVEVTGRGLCSNAVPSWFRASGRNHIGPRAVASGQTTSAHHCERVGGGEGCVKCKTTVRYPNCHHAHTYAPKEQRRPTGTFPLSRNQFHPG